LIFMNLQEIGENVLMAFDTLRTHKVRSALTMLGVIGGTMTVRFAFTLLGVSLALSACDRPAITDPKLAPPSRPSLVTNGSLDGANHPGVVLIIMDVAGSPAFRCTGTMLSARVVLTAGPGDVPLPGRL